MLCRAKHGGHKAVHQKAEVWVRSREQPNKRTSSPKSRGTTAPDDAWPAAARRMHAHGRGEASCVRHAAEARTNRFLCGHRLFAFCEPFFGPFLSAMLTLTAAVEAVTVRLLP